MNEPQADKIYNKAIKIASVQMNYKPGPIMEEKVIKMIRRKKLASTIYKVGFFSIIVLAVLLIGSEKLGIINLSSNLSAKGNGDNTPQVISDDTETSNGMTLSNSTNEEDPVFKMMKYVSVASDGNWLTSW